MDLSGFWILLKKEIVAFSYQMQKTKTSK